MAADFKSHILSRDEKGFGGVPFKRLLAGGIAGGCAYTLSRFLLPGGAIPIGLLGAVLVIGLTAPRGGLPLWLRLWFTLRGSLLLAATRQPEGLAAELVALLSLPLDVVRLDGQRLFAPPAALVELDLSEWVTFARARDLDRNDGLVFVTSALTEEEA